MATIESRVSNDGTKKFRVKVRKRGFPTQSATFDRITDARKWGSQTETDIERGQHFEGVNAKKHTLGEMIDRFTRDVIPTKGKYASQAQLPQLNWWKQQLGTYRLSHITPALIAEKRDLLLSSSTHQGEKRSPSTVVRYLASLSGVYTHGIREWSWVRENPVVSV